MVLEAFAEAPLVRGFVFALLGVGFWVGGLVFFNWVWNHYRGDADADPGADAGAETDADERPGGDNV